MARPDYDPPEFRKDGFNCPHCAIWAHQRWGGTLSQVPGVGNIQADDVTLAWCQRCNKPSTWYDSLLVHPVVGTAPPPNPDLPKEIQRDYDEARDIVPRSPRGAAALLRLAIQRLCIHLGEQGDNLNDDIKNLVAKGLPRGIQRSLDAVRVIGNNAVHPGQIDLDDQPEIAHGLFRLVNLIVEKMISESDEIDDIYNKLPNGARRAIEKRNGTEQGEGE